MANPGGMETSAPTHTITVAEAAEALGVSERTVWRYLKSGRLPGETVGEPGSQRTLIPRDGRRGPHDRPRRGGRRGPASPSATGCAAELAAARAERDALIERVARAAAGAVGADAARHRRARPLTRHERGRPRPRSAHLLAALIP